MTKTAHFLAKALLLVASFHTAAAAEFRADAGAHGTLCDARVSSLEPTIENNRLRATLQVDVLDCDTSTGLVEYTVYFQRPDRSQFRHTYGQRWRAAQSETSFELPVLVTTSQQERPLRIDRIRLLSCQCWDD